MPPRPDLVAKTAPPRDLAQIRACGRLVFGRFSTGANIWPPTRPRHRSTALAGSGPGSVPERGQARELLGEAPAPLSPRAWRRGRGRGRVSGRMVHILYSGRSRTRRCPSRRLRDPRQRRTRRRRSVHPPRSGPSPGRRTRYRGRQTHLVGRPDAVDRGWLRLMGDEHDFGPGASGAGLRPRRVHRDVHRSPVLVCVAREVGRCRRRCDEALM